MCASFRTLDRIADAAARGDRAGRRGRSRSEPSIVLFGERADQRGRASHSPASTIVARLLSPHRDRQGLHPVVDPMRIDDDPAFGGLAEDLGQADDRHHIRANNIREHLAGADRGQLIDVTDEHQCGMIRQRVQQCVHQRHVDHRRLLDAELLGDHDRRS